MSREKKVSMLARTSMMIVLFLAVALGLVSAILIRQRGIVGTAESVRALELAGVGFERVISSYRENSSAMTIGEIVPGECEEGAVTQDTDAGRYEVSFVDEGGNSLNSCDDFISKISKIRVSAMVDSSTEMIETAFAASGAYQSSCVPRPWETWEATPQTPPSYRRNTMICCTMATATSNTRCKEMQWDDYTWDGLGDEIDDADW